MGYNVLRQVGSYYLFAGNSPGYATTLQKKAFQNNADDTFLMKYLVNKQNTYTCLYEGLTNVPTNPAILSTIRKASTIAGDTASSTSSIVDYYNFFKVYSSPYSGAFNLLDTMYIPRACAEASLNLTQFNYFYGQNAHNYSIRQQANLASYTVRPTTVLA